MTIRYLRSTDGNDTDDGSTWALAEATLASAFAGLAANDTIYVSQAHNNAQAGTITITPPTTAPGVTVICANDGAEPPTAAATGAVEATNGATLINLVGGYATFNGLVFDAGQGQTSSACVINAPSGVTPTGYVFNQCAFKLSTTGSTARFNFGQIAGSGHDNCVITVKNSTFKFGSTAQSIQLMSGILTFDNITIDSAGVAPVTLFLLTTGTHPQVVIKNSNLSGEAWTNLINIGIVSFASVIVKRCQFPASFTIKNGSSPGPGGPFVGVYDCHSGDVHGYFYEYQWEGSAQYETAVYRNSGSTLYSVNVSAKLTGENGSWGFPLRFGLNAKEISSLGSAKTLTARIAFDNATDLTNAKCWIEVQAYTTSGVPLGTVYSSRVADILATPANLTADGTSTWTGTGGWANAKKREIAVTFTPQEIGYIETHLYLAEGSNYVLYADLDPDVT